MESIFALFFFFGWCYSYGPQQGPDRQQKKRGGRAQAEEKAKGSCSRRPRTKERKPGKRKIPKSWSCFLELLHFHASIHQIIRRRKELSDKGLEYQAQTSKSTRRNRICRAKTKGIIYMPPVPATASLNMSGGSSSRMFLTDGSLWKLFKAQYEWGAMVGMCVDALNQVF